ncbi:hypothetical protein F5J12DRAFT_787431 [Pisolithus orientalis]|uniref:uncharacterized protein n=1 Tax=Pisolithus orientalis TaxID=936130 RepID=UPI00222417BC|nr:uncharacterized protein F5J12DRAFT_787431 [Pisolithus orientalis]KAI5985229.1 hypothetical protein F5J12DRAFT_787431 [Pisolithus orientalis]
MHSSDLIANIAVSGIAVAGWSVVHSSDLIANLAVAGWPITAAACGAIIPKGAPRHYIATINIGKPGRWYIHTDKIIAAACPSVLTSVPDPQVIWCSVSDVRHSCSDPPPVLAIAHSWMNTGIAKPQASPNTASSMLTTLEGLVALIIQKQGFKSWVPGHCSSPDIHVPSAWQVPCDMAQIHLGECNVLSQVQQQQHALYHAQQDHWMNQVYQPPPSETISLEISALHEGGPQKGHMHATPFGVE